MLSDWKSWLTASPSAEGRLSSCQAKSCQVWQRQLHHDIWKTTRLPEGHHPQIMDREMLPGQGWWCLLDTSIRSTVIRNRRTDQSSAGVSSGGPLMTSLLWCFMKRGELAASCHSGVAQAHSEHWMRVIVIYRFKIIALVYPQGPSIEQNLDWNSDVARTDKKTQQIENYK